jgi:hypothetical protein
MIDSASFSALTDHAGIGCGHARSVKDSAWRRQSDDAGGRMTFEPAS